MQRENMTPTIQPPKRDDHSPAHARCPAKSTARRIGSLAFYAVLAAALVVGLMYGTRAIGAKNILGFSVFEVLTDSMQSEIPQGSLVLTRRTSPERLRIGDDITFLVGANKTYTHRIVGVYENYEDSGQYGFETQGVENDMPDADITYADNVVGRVVWHWGGFRGTLDWATGHWYAVVCPLLLLSGTAVALKIAFKKESHIPEKHSRYRV